MDFLCNICGTQSKGVEEFGREAAHCKECLSTVRIRALMYALSIELFGTPLPLEDFPVLKNLRGLGMTDSVSYAKRIAEKFDYKNTFFDREPRLDITEIGGWHEGAFDFIISSEVFEHVRPPVEEALRNAFRLLSPNGFLLLSVPYHLDDWPSVEHFSQFDDSALAQLRGGPVLVNRTTEGELQVFDNLIFHLGPGAALEMRFFNETSLRSALRSAGFSDLQFYGQDYMSFGIRHVGSWSLPVVARKQLFEWPAALRRELVQNFGDLSDQLRQHKAETARQQAKIGQQVVENAALNQEMNARTAWAHNLDREMIESRLRFGQLQAEFEERTAWALGLECELEQRNQLAGSMQNEMESRTKWAQGLDSQLEERTQWALELEARAKRLENDLASLRAKWWYRVGRRLRVL